MYLFCIFFPWKCSLFTTLSADQLSITDLLSFSWYQTISVFESFSNQLMMSRTLRFIFDQPFKQLLTGEERGEKGNTKSEYLKNEKSFLAEIKNIFHYFLRMWWKKKRKITDTSFKKGVGWVKSEMCGHPCSQKITHVSYGSFPLFELHKSYSNYL